MAGSVNKVILIGNLGKDPEIRTFQSGGRVASFSIATSESWKDKNSGERKEKTEWHRISVLDDKLVEIVEKYVKKGSKLYIEGQLETREYEKDGQKRYMTEVALRPFRSSLTMLDSKGSGGGGYSSSSSAGAAADDSFGDSSSGGSQGRADEFDDNVPF
ncbi:MAG: single-stranded DNA-binding protein [Alphaproteobacteria bacterium]|nr:single-stranded DNA-binding protein [Alphaproteobacteria bacterium]MCL2504711.1 single-stranded DNA-binding protein [Alphaproteobacteria bacterium]